MEKRNHVGTEMSHDVSQKTHVHPQHSQWVEQLVVNLAITQKFTIILGSGRLQLKPLWLEKVEDTGLTKVLPRL